MKRQFIAITQDEIDARHAETLRSREMELASYDFERETHETAIATLGHLEWDDNTLPYRGTTRDEMLTRALQNGLSSDQITHISDLMALDAHRINLEAVKIETAKSERHYQASLDALPEGKRRDAALAAIGPEESV